MLSRRHLLRAGGAFLAGLSFAGTAAGEGEVAEIVMRGNADGSRVWFDPLGLLLRPGQRVRWINRDPGNSHTSTAYHPASDGRPLRMPAAAAPWDSGYLLPDEQFELVLEAPGVYDYFCLPHEHAGMLGRLVVLAAGGPLPEAVPGSPVEGIAAEAFPAVAEIVRHGRVAAPGGG